MEEQDLPIEEIGGFEQDESIGGAEDNGWKDELNLAEFPIAALSDRVPDGQTTLVFEDKLERRDSEPIVRRLTIMGTAKHGLPTSLDDEVLVGLIQLTKRRSNFADARVSFSRYELIELLGWPQSGQSYKRIEEALNRWVGVVLMYENAWWDNAAKSWVDENFHVLDNVTLYDRERRKRGKGGKGVSARGGKSAAAKAEKAPLPLSSFRWNDVIFQSFQSGNLKQLDLEFYLKLRLPTTKRMFRFLDKRFYRKTRLDFDLRILACEHIGMSRSYAPTELKRRLRPALEELEELGFLEPLTNEERYSYVSRGCWRIILIRSRSQGGDQDQADGPAELVEALTTRGVTPKSAAEIVEGNDAGRIRTKIEVFDWLVKNLDKRVAKNPAGYLVASIKSDYEPPGDFKPRPASRAAKSGKATTLDATATPVESSPEPERRREKAKARREAEKENAREVALRARWESLTSGQKAAILQVVKAQNPGLERFPKMLEPLCLAELERRSAADPQGKLF